MLNSVADMIEIVLLISVVLAPLSLPVFLGLKLPKLTAKARPTAS